MARVEDTWGHWGTKNKTKTQTNNLRKPGLQKKKIHDLLGKFGPRKSSVLYGMHCAIQHERALSLK